jgi:hypothetical protein
MAHAVEYAIRRLNWRPTHYGTVRMPGYTPVGALPTFEEAEDDRRRREAEARERVVNPFLCGPNHAARSRLPEPVFCDWLRDAGIEPPASDWGAWWTAIRPSLSAEQVGHVWAGLDRVRFFEVVARPEGRVGYAVVSVEWEYNDNWMEPGAEGGTPLKVFRRWAAAEAYLRQSEEEVRRIYQPDPYDDEPMRFDVQRWANETHWPLGPDPVGRPDYETTAFASGLEAPFYEIVEVELPDDGNSDE